MTSSTLVPVESGTSALEAATLPAAALSGARKAAVLLASMGTERAAIVLRRLSESEVAEILGEIASLEDVDAELIDAVMTELAVTADSHRHGTAGGIGMARELLSASVDSDRADAVARRLPADARPAAFPFLTLVDPPVAASMLGDEHPQTIALVLVNIAPELAASLLKEMPEELQREVALRIANLDRTTPEVIAIIEEQLARRFSSLGSDEQQQVGGVDALVALLGKSDERTEKAIVEGLGELDAALADRVRAAMFSFEDLITLDDRAVQQVLRGVDSKDLATALKGASEQIKDKLLSNLSQRAAETLREDIELLGRVRTAAVEEARGNVMKVVREMEENGQIQLERSGSSDDFVD